MIVVGVTAALPAEKEIKLGGRRIVGGEPTQIEKHPWQVALTIERRDIEFFCGGSIIAQKWILSAAHCFLSSDAAAGVKVKAGATNIETQGVWTDVEKVILHEAYNTTTNENDIALVKLKAAPAGRVIPLVDASAALPISQPLEVTGWGTTKENGDTSDTLVQATVPLVDTATCNGPDSYAGRVLPGMMCAGHRDGGIDACQGDSGGPLVWRTDDGPVLVGVVSFGDGCAKKLKFGIYTRVSSYRAWIFRTMNANR